MVPCFAKQGVILLLGCLCLHQHISQAVEIIQPSKTNEDLSITPREGKYLESASHGAKSSPSTSNPSSAQYSARASGVVPNGSALGYPPNPFGSSYSYSPLYQQGLDVTSLGAEGANVPFISGPSLAAAGLIPPPPALLQGVYGGLYNPLLNPVINPAAIGIGLQELAALNQIGQLNAAAANARAFEAQRNSLPFAAAGVPLVQFVQPQLLPLGYSNRPVFQLNPSNAHQLQGSAYREQPTSQTRQGVAPGELPQSNGDEARFLSQSAWTQLVPSLSYDPTTGTYLPSKPSIFAQKKPSIATSTFIDGDTPTGGTPTVVSGSASFFQPAANKDITTFITLSGLDTTATLLYNIEIFTSADVATPNCAGTGALYNFGGYSGVIARSLPALTGTLTFNAVVPASQISLYGASTIIGHSVVVREITTNTRVACGVINKVL